MVHKITLGQACDGLIRSRMAAGLSSHAIADYENTFKKLFLFFDDEIPLQVISRKEMVDFFAWLREDYIGPMNSNYLTIQAIIYTSNERNRNRSTRRFDTFSMS